MEAHTWSRAVPKRDLFEGGARKLATDPIETSGGTRWPARRRVAPSCQQEYSSTIMPARGLPASHPAVYCREAARAACGRPCGSGGVPYAVGAGPGHMHACMRAGPSARRGRVRSIVSAGGAPGAGDVAAGAKRASAPPAAPGATTPPRRAVTVPLPWLLACQRRLRAIELYGYRPIDRSIYRLPTVGSPSSAAELVYRAVRTPWSRTGSAEIRR